MAQRSALQTDASLRGFLLHTPVHEQWSQTNDPECGQAEGYSREECCGGTERFPQQTCDSARNEERNATDQVEESVSRPAKVRRSRVGDHWRGA